MTTAVTDRPISRKFRALQSALGKPLKQVALEAAARIDTYDKIAEGWQEKVAEVFPGEEFRYAKGDVSRLFKSFGIQNRAVRVSEGANSAADQAEDTRTDPTPAAATA